MTGPFDPSSDPERDPESPSRENLFRPRSQSPGAAGPYPSDRAYPAGQPYRGDGAAQEDLFTPAVSTDGAGAQAPDGDGSAQAQTVVPDEATDGTDSEQPGPGGVLRGVLRGAREVALVLGIALVLSLLIKTFLVQAFFIPSQSMENTLLVGDRVMVSKWTPAHSPLHRGDIVVFRDPDHWLGDPEPKHDNAVVHAFRESMMFVGLLPTDANQHLIKRVIGLPGDTVACCDAQGRMTVNGYPLDESYIYPGDRPSDAFTVTVPAGHIWVMGDHRSLSADSRRHRGGPADGSVPIKDVVGKAFVVIWPFDRAKFLSDESKVFKGVPNPSPTP